MGGGHRFAATGIPVLPLFYPKMKWYIPLVIIGSVLILFALFGEPGTPALIYETETTPADADPLNLTLTYMVTLTVKNNGTAAADNIIASVSVTTPPGAPEWQQTDLIFPIGSIAAGGEVTQSNTTSLTVNEDTYALLVNGSLPETTVFATYSDAFF